MNKTLQYLEELVGIPSPTGMTGLAEEYLLNWAHDRGITARTSHKGVVTYHFTPQKDSAAPPCILTSHIDTLGAMVAEVNDEGLRIVPIGGYPALYAMGNYCSVHGRSNTMSGTILPKNPAVHVNRNLRDLAPAFEDMYVRLDNEINSNSNEEIHTGDFISFDPQFVATNGYVKSRHLDDKASAAVMLTLAEELQQTPPSRECIFIFNTTEETGQGLVSEVQQADLLVIDMGVVGDGCQGKETHVSICSKDSSGPYHFEFIRELEDLCKNNDLNYVKDIFPYYQSDGSKSLAAGKDYRVALIGPGVSASHGWERTHSEGIKNTLKLARLVCKGA